MKRILLVAQREFLATVGTKGFIIGLLMMPALFLLFAVFGPRIINSRSPQVRGDVAVVDPTGQVTAELRTALDPATIAARRTENVQRAVAQAAPALGRANASTAAQAALGQIPQLRLVDRPAGADVQREKDWLLAPAADPQAAPHLALVVMHPDAVVRRAGTPDYGTYDLYVSRALDDATEGVIYEGLRQALVSARLRASSLDQGAVEATMRVTRPRSVVVAADGEQAAQRGLNRTLPFAFGLLLFIGVIVGGQTLMTSTIEEKSSRVVEVLLAAVSPFELMAGKLLGQLAVGLVVMALYIGLGSAALFSFAMFGLVDLSLVAYLMVFFLITYLIFGAMMIAIGAAVNQIADAQSLMAPVMMLLIIPYALTTMIGRAPNSTFSVILSFVPPFNTFIMMARLASEAPPPAWQPLLTIVIGLAAALACVWFAAKVFKIGLLMHGKPPNIATLIRWARAA
jgi:ABC-2 type transport system permease protein